MRVPQVVIVGRPNVGKSSLFNWLAQRRIAIVDDQPGVTRDRITHLLCENDRYFELVDTGGYGFEDTDNLTSKVEEQIELGIESASLLLFVVDSRDGLMPLDRVVADKLRYVTSPVICVANKTDTPAMDTQADEFYRLGRGKVLRVSTHQNRGRDELMQAILERIPEDKGLPPIPYPDPELKFAIVGKRNAGKSTFVNTLAQAERMIVSEVPGTTRDSVDVRFEMDGKTFVAIDTPGLHRRQSTSTDVEFYSLHRAQRSIRRADVVLHFFDAGDQITKVDKQLCDYVAEQFKPVVFVVNKWDLYQKQIATEKWVAYLHDAFRSMRHVPIAFITGKQGKNVKALLNHAQSMFKQTRHRVSTAELNRVIQFAVQKVSPPLVDGKRPKIFYATQVGEQPPTIIVFANMLKALGPNYQRYLLGVLRDELPFKEVPIKLYFRKRTRPEDDIKLSK